MSFIISDITGPKKIIYYIYTNNQNVDTPYEEAFPALFVYNSHIGSTCSKLHLAGTSVLPLQI